MKKRVLSIILSLVMIVSLMPMPAFADPDPAGKPVPTADMFSFTEPEDCVYDGTGKEAKIEPVNGITGIGNVSIRYYSVNEYETPVEKPVNAGEYKVKISVSEGESYSAISELSDPNWTFKITPATLPPDLTGLEITTPPVRTDYSAGEVFDPSGMVVTASYSDGSSKPVTGYKFEPSDALELTDELVKISYIENGVTENAIQLISVTKKNTSTFGKKLADLLDGNIYQLGDPELYLRVRESGEDWYYIDFLVDEVSWRSYMPITSDTSVESAGSSAWKYSFNGDTFIFTLNAAGTEVVSVTASLDGTFSERNGIYAPYVHVHKWTEWGGNETYHWKECDVNPCLPACDFTDNTKKPDYGVHTGMEDRVCDTCGLFIPLSSIEIKQAPAKTEYDEGECFDPTGMVVNAIYLNGDSVKITDYEVSPSDALTKDITQVTVSYTENGITKTAVQNVSVLNRAWKLLQDTISGTISASDNVYFKCTADGSGSKIELKQDIVCPDDLGSLTVYAGKTVVIDLKGHDIDRALTAPAAGGSVIIVNGTLTVSDSEGGGKITGGKTSSYAGGGVTVAAGGTFTLSGGEISGNNAEHSGGGVYSDGSAIMTAGSISKNSSVSGGGVYISSSGNFSMSGGEISDNSAEFGGGVYNCGSAELTGGMVSGNSATVNAGGAGGNGGQLKVGGTAVVTENTLNGEACNVLFSASDKIGFSDTKPAAGMNIGVTADEFMMGAKVFTSKAADGYAGYFFSDDDAYTVIYDSNKYLQLAEAYDITVSSPMANGTVTADKEKAAEGETVTLSVTPDAGYALKAGTLKATDESGTDVPITSNAFTMPASAVTVNAEFEEMVLTGISITAQPSKTEYAAGETFDKTGMVVTASYSNGSSNPVTDYTFAPDGALKESDTKITVSYTEDGVTKTAEQSVTVGPAVLTGIEVTTPPSKTGYFAGQSFDKTGMVVTASYSDGSSKPVTDYSFEPTGALKETDAKITVSYTEDGITKTCEQTVTVEKVVLTGIEISTAPSKTEYNAGETFDKTGMEVTAGYNDGSSKQVTDYTFEPDGALKETDTKVTISYTEDGVTKTAEQSVTVGPAKLLKIEITKKPAKKDYKIGETFAPEGMVVTATYGDGSTEPVTGYTVSPKGALKITDTSVTISFEHNGETKTATIDIKVEEVEYEMLDGSNGTWVKGSTGDLGFRSSAPYEKFVCVQVDGAIVASDYYTVASGSTIVRLKAAYLKTLSVGKHQLVIVSEDGRASCYFTIKDPTNVPTGDSNHLLLWIAVFTAALAGEAAVIVTGSKKRLKR